MVSPRTSNNLVHQTYSQRYGRCWNLDHGDFVEAKQTIVELGYSTEVLEAVVRRYIYTDVADILGFGKKASDESADLAYLARKKCPLAHRHRWAQINPNLGVAFGLT
jgi:hypothetical protein